MSCLHIHAALETIFHRHLDNYFRLHLCLSFHTFVHLYITFPFFSIPAIVSQNVTDKSCLACVKSEKYVVWVTPRPLRSIKLGEAELCVLNIREGEAKLSILKLTSLFYLPRLCAVYCQTLKQRKVLK